MSKCTSFSGARNFVVHLHLIHIVAVQWGFNISDGGKEGKEVTSERGISVTGSRFPPPPVYNPYIAESFLGGEALGELCENYRQTSSLLKLCKQDSLCRGNIVPAPLLNSPKPFPNSPHRWFKGGILHIECGRKAFTDVSQSRLSFFWAYFKPKYLKTNLNHVI